MKEIYKSISFFHFNRTNFITVDISIYMSSKIIMGLDASSSTIGISIIKIEDEKPILIYVDHYKPPKKGSIFERLATIKKYILSKFDEFSPDEVIIEEFIQFLKGSSGASTIIILALVNRTIGLTLYEYSEKEPIMVNVNTVRSVIRPENYIGRVMKESVPEVVEGILGIKLEKLYGKKGKFLDENYDRADSIAVGLSYILSNSVEKSIKKKTKRSRKPKAITT